jgi:L-asparagine oxygenase
MTPPQLITVHEPAWDEPRVTATDLETLAEHAGEEDLPRSVELVLDLVRRGVRPGAVLRRAPLGLIPTTPPSPQAASGKNLTSEATLLSVAARLGDAVGYAPEHGGSVVQNLVPTRQGADRQVSTSSKVTLELHTEAAFHPYRPQYLTLLCLRGDPNAGTTYALADEIAGALDETTLRVLGEARFDTGVDESYLGEGGETAWRTEPHAVLWEEDGWRCRFDAVLTRGLDPQAERAAQAMIDATRWATRRVVLTDGDLLVLDNTRVIHGRSPYTPRFDGTDRWLQRSFVHADLSTIPAGDLVGRIVTTRFVR